MKGANTRANFFYLIMPQGVPYWQARTGYRKIIL